MNKEGMVRKLAMGACAAALCVAAVGGTFAYLTDRDSRANVFTTGDMSVRLDEKFEQGSKLVPGVMVQKEATITNTESTDAYVWMTVAVPAALDNVKASDGEKTYSALYWGAQSQFWYGNNDPSKVPSEDTWLITTETGDLGTLERVEPVTTTIGGVEYRVYTLLYLGALAPDEITNVGLSNVWLDEHVDISPKGDVCWVSSEGGQTETFTFDWNVNEDGSPTVYVSAYAMQTEGFEDVIEAYESYQKQWGGSGAEYVAPSVIKTE